MSKKLLIKNAFIYTLTDVINKAIPFLLLPILTKYLSPSDYGIVATYAAYLAILTVFIHVNMTNAVNVVFYEKSIEKLRIYIANTIAISITFTIFLTFIVFLFSEYLSKTMSIPIIWLFIGIFIVFMQYITSLNLVLWQAEQKARAYGLYQIFQTLINFSLVLFLIIILKLGWEGQLLGQGIAFSLFAIGSFYLLFKRGYLQLTLSIQYIIDALKFGVPLIPLALSGWFRTGVDRIFLMNFIGASATGLYVVGFQFGMIIGILSVAFNKAYNQFLYRKLKDIKNEDKNELVSYTYIYFILILLLATIISIISPWLIEKFLNERYIGASEIVPLIAFAYAFQGMYIMVVNYLYYIKKTVYLAYVAFGTGAIHVILSFILIKTNGIIGAAQASVVSFFIMFISVWVLSSKLYPMPWLKPKIKIWK